jgi:hypothetical protein
MQDICNEVTSSGRGKVALYHSLRADKFCSQKCIYFYTDQTHVASVRDWKIDKS